jgi:DNA-directed RNA polymerase subunit RPC12/RpoP
MNGSDITIAQYLLQRSPFVNGTLPVCCGCSTTFDSEANPSLEGRLLRCVHCRRRVAVPERQWPVRASLSLLVVDIDRDVTGALDSTSANLLLQLHIADGYKDDGRVPTGYLYKRMLACSG